MDWTIGPLDYFFGPFCGPFFYFTFFNHFIGGSKATSTQVGVVGRLLLMREGRRSNCKYTKGSGRLMYK